MLTCTTHCLLGWKIWYKKRSLSQNGWQPQAKIFAICQQSHLEQPSSDTFLLDHCSSFKFLALLLPLVPVLFISLLHFAGMPLILTRLAVTSAIMAIMPLSVYARKPHVRKTLKREIRAWFQQMRNP